LVRIARNLRDVAVKPASDLTCYDVVASSRVLVTAQAFKQLEVLSV
jgi:ribosomal protein L4